MKAFKKIYEFGFMTLIHPSGHTDRVQIPQLENSIAEIDDNIKRLKAERKILLDDRAKISSKYRIKRFFIKRKVAKDGKTQTETGQTQYP